MLIYENLNKFYDGDDFENTTPLTSFYLNSIINQIEINFKNLDSRLEIIESIIKNKIIYVNEAHITNAYIDNLINKISNIETLNSINGNIDILNSKTANIDNLTSNILNSKEIKVNNLNADNTILNNATINTLKINELNINSNYILENNKIYFFGNQPGILFEIKNTNSTNGIRFEKNINYESNARIEFTQNTFDIEFLSEHNDNDNMNINTNCNLNIKSKNINIETKNILPTNLVNIGSNKYPFDKIYANQFYGTYMSKEADLGEYYETDKNYEPGTLLMVGIETEATIWDPENPRPIIGIVSEKPGIILNKEFKNKGNIIGLKGRLYCKLSNKGSRGDYIIPDDKLKGYCKAVKNKQENIIGILIDPENNIIKV